LAHHIDVYWFSGLFRLKRSEKSAFVTEKINKDYNN